MAPSSLEVPQSSHGKMMVSPPRLNLRRAGSYQVEKGPQSATSSRFNFNHLVFDPPPSPSLPSLNPRPRKSSSAPRPSRVMRTVGWVAALVAFLFIASAVVKQRVDVPIVSWALEDRTKYEMVGQYDLPEFPTPIAITDARGKSKWTVSIPPTYQFPLSIDEYSDMCAKCHEVAAHVRELHGKEAMDPAQTNYYYEDSNFIDVFEAEEKGLLPGIDGQAWKVAARAQEGHLVGDTQDGLVDKDTCESSLTFVLESPEAGLGPALMMLWMAYGLAQKENRAFFIDDSRWAYGDYTKLFQAPPMPKCSAPPRHEMLPCPRQARHLVVSAATGREIFGRTFSAIYENPRASSIEQERPMFDLARTGYEALFKLNLEDLPYVEERAANIRIKSRVTSRGHHNGTVVGIHVRHGDVHPYEFQYHGSYIPLNIYTEKASALIDEYHNTTVEGGEDSVAKSRSQLVLASDDPAVYDSYELSKATRAQDLIELANKAEEGQKSKGAMRKFVEESVGWEGGFYSSMFWNLGRSSINNANAAELPQTVLGPSSEMMHLRELLGRAYAIDLAVLQKASDVVICTTSATACRLLAVMMGWQKAMVEEKWVNIDGDFSWTGLTF